MALLLIAEAAIIRSVDGTVTPFLLSNEPSEDASKKLSSERGREWNPLKSDDTLLNSSSFEMPLKISTTIIPLTATRSAVITSFIKFLSPYES